MGIPIYGIFEGGGAKGIGHVAAIKAAEDLDLEFIGVAGASAGALVASLIAVGYRADDIFDPQLPTSNILSRRNLHPLDLLGPREGWDDFKAVQAKIEQASTNHVLIGALRLLLSRNVQKLFKQLRADGGIFSTEVLRDTLNKLYQEKLRQHLSEDPKRCNEPIPDRITFAHIAPTNVEKCCSLKIIVTDVTSRQMIVFDSTDERYNNVEVAQAVAASVAIPLVFKPASIPSFDKTKLFVDGGMVSNMPAWVFKEEKLHYERTKMPNGKVPVVCFSLNDTQPGALTSYKPLPYAVAVGETAIFSGQSAVNDFVSDRISVPLTTNLATTSFELDLKTAKAAFDSAKADAENVLKREFETGPAEDATVLQDIHDSICELIKNALPPAAQPAYVRLFVFQPYGRYSFRAVRQVNAHVDADDRLLFSNRVAGVPEAHELRMPAYLDFSQMWHKNSNVNMSKYEFALVRRNVRSAICMPVFDLMSRWSIEDPSKRPAPVAVASIDCDQDLSPIFKDARTLRKVSRQLHMISSLL